MPLYEIRFQNNINSLSIFFLSSHYWSEETESCKLCKFGWRPLMNTCYRYFENQITWNEAKDQCEKLNSSLIILNDMNKLKSYQKIIQNIRDINPNKEAKYYKTWVTLNRIIRYLINSK